jgi:cation diffusion facilitator family transporter
MPAHPLRGPIILSIGAALATIGLKSTAYLLTGSVGLLSDALESGINLFAAVTAYLSLWYAARPVDRTHTYGHEKIEYFSSGLEGGLITIAGVGIILIAVERLIRPTPLEQLGLGTALALVASAINFAVALVLLRVGRKHQSIVLEADGEHLMSDVLTSVAVVAGLGVVWATGLYWLDPIIAIIVGLYILRTAFGLIRRSFDGLMDRAWPEEDQTALRDLIHRTIPPGTTFHALRTRRAGSRRFADFHLLVPGNLTVRAAHEFAEAIESAVREALPSVQLTIHIEPIEEQASWADNVLADFEPNVDRPEQP